MPFHIHLKTADIDDGFALIDQTLDIIHRRVWVIKEMALAVEIHRPGPWLGDPVLTTPGFNAADRAQQILGDASFRSRRTCRLITG